MDIADRIKTVRKKSNLTQKEFAERILVTQAYVSALEAGKERPSDILLKLISLEFKVAYDWIKNGEGDYQLTSSAYDFFDRNNADGNIQLLKEQFELLSNALPNANSSEYLDLGFSFEFFANILQSKNISSGQKTLIIQNIANLFSFTEELLEENKKGNLYHFFIKSYFEQENYYKELYKILDPSENYK